MNLFFNSDARNSRQQDNMNNNGIDLNYYDEKDYLMKYLQKSESKSKR